MCSAVRETVSAIGWDVRKKFNGIQCTAYNLYKYHRSGSNGQWYPAIPYIQSHLKEIGDHPLEREFQSLDGQKAIEKWYHET